MLSSEFQPARVVTDVDALCFTRRTRAAAVRAAVTDAAERASGAERGANQGATHAAVSAATRAADAEAHAAKTNVRVSEVEARAADTSVFECSTEGLNKIETTGRGAPRELADRAARSSRARTPGLCVLLAPRRHNATRHTHGEVVPSYCKWHALVRS